MLGVTLICLTFIDQWWQIPVNVKAYRLKPFCLVPLQPYKVATIQLHVMSPHVLLEYTSSSHRKQSHFKPQQSCLRASEYAWKGGRGETEWAAFVV